MAWVVRKYLNVANVGKLTQTINEETRCSAPGRLHTARGRKIQAQLVHTSRGPPHRSRVVPLLSWPVVRVSTVLIADNPKS